MSTTQQRSAEGKAKVARFTQRLPALPTRLLPNPSVNATAHGWAVVACLGQFGYLPSHATPAQPRASRYLKRWASTWGCLTYA